MQINIRSTLSDTIIYDIFINKKFEKQVCIKSNEINRLTLPDNVSNFTLSFKPHFFKKGHIFLNLIAFLWSTLFSYFLLIVTWGDNNILPAIDMFDLRAEECFKIVLRDNSRIEFLIEKKKTNNKKGIYKTTIKTSNCEHSKIEKLKSNFNNAIFGLKMQLRHWIAFYITLFLPADILFSILIWLGANIRNWVMVLLCLILLLVLLLINSTFIFITFKIYKRYNSYCAGHIKTGDGSLS